METLKKPEMLVAMSSLFAVGGTYFYFYKKLGLVNERIDEFDKRLSSVIKKVGDNSRDVTALGRNIAELNNYLQGLTQNMKKLELNMLDYQDLQNERYQNLVEAIEGLGGTVFDPTRRPTKPKRWNEDRDSRDRSEPRERQVERGQVERDRSDRDRSERQVERDRPDRDRSDRDRSEPLRSERQVDRSESSRLDRSEPLRSERSEPSRLDRSERLERQTDRSFDREQSYPTRSNGRKVKFEEKNSNLLDLNLEDKKHSDSDSDDDFIEKTKN